MKRINKWFTRNHNEVIGNSPHFMRGGRVVVGKAVSELNRYRDEKAKQLMRLPREELVRMIKHKSALELQRRYGVDRIPEKELPPIELKEERRIELSKEDIRRLKLSARRKKKVVHTKLQVKKPAKIERKRLTKRTAQKGTLNYVKAIFDYNAKMASVRNIAGLEG